MANGIAVPLPMFFRENSPMMTRKVQLASEQSLLNGAIIGMFLLLYAPLLIHWYNGWLNKTISIEHEYFSHGLIGIPFAIYIAWTQRQQWKRLPDRVHPVGGVLLLLAGICYLSRPTDLVNLSLPLLLAGYCLWSKGVAGLRLQLFPLLLVLLATPNEIPYLLTPFTLPLQSFIAHMAGFILNQAGMDVAVEQIYLTVGGRIVEVAPYCAGLKMLFTSLYVSLMLLYWTGLLTSRVATGFLLVGAIVISTSANVLRNTLLTFFYGTGQDGLFHWLHDGWGGDVYSALMLGLIVLLLNQIEKQIAPAS